MRSGLNTVFSTNHTTDNTIEQRMNGSIHELYLLLSLNTTMPSLQETKKL